MAVECLVITGLFLFIALLYIRRKRKEWAMAVLPLVLVPFSIFVLEYPVARLFGVPVKLFVGIVTVMAAVAASAALIGAASGLLKHKRTRVTYIIITNAFNVVFAAIVINYYFTLTAGDPNALIK